MSRSYNVSPKHLLRINPPPGLVLDSSTMGDTESTTSSLTNRERKVCAPLSPVNERYYEDSSSEDDDDEIDDDHEDRRRFVMPLTPSPLNVSNQPAENVNIIHQEVKSSESEEQDDQEQNVF